MNQLEQTSSVQTSNAHHAPDGPMLIVMAGDRDFAMPLATALRSIAESNRRTWPISVNILTDCMPDDLRRDIHNSLPPDAVSIKWQTVDLDLFDNVSTLSFISKATFARLLIPHIMPETQRRVLYLDSDLLVLDDLLPLWECDLQGAVVAAAPDRWAPQIKLRDKGLEKVPVVDSYFNAGVLLIDLEKWRAEKISEKALEYLAANPSSPFSDQDALNVACDGKWRELDCRWNFQEHDLVSVATIQKEGKPTIVHFVSGIKPWKPEKLNINAGFFDSFRSRTKFSRSNKEKIEDALIVTRSKLSVALKKHAPIRQVIDFLRRKPRQR